MAEEVKQDVNQNADATSTSEGQPQGTAQDGQATESTVEKDTALSLQARVKELSDKNARTESLLMAILQQQGQKQGNQGPSQVELDPDLDPAVAKALNQLSQQQTQQFQGMYGGVVEELDKMAIGQTPYAKRYNELSSEVESFREMKGRSGVYFTREEALAIVCAKKGIPLTEAQQSRQSVVKQDGMRPGGSTQNAGGGTSTQQKPTTAKERLIGKVF